LATIPSTQQHNSTPSGPAPSDAGPSDAGRGRGLKKLDGGRGVLGPMAVLFALMLGLLCFLVSFSIGNFGRLIEADRWNVHTYRVLIESGQMLESIVAMDAGVRSFLNTGDSAKLAAYNEGQASFEQHFERTLAMTSDRPQQQARLRTLLAQKAQWQPLLDSAMRVRRRIKDTTRSLTITVRGAGDRAAKLNEMRMTLESFQAYEEDLLRERSARQESFQVETGRTLLVGGLFSIALAGGLCAIVLSNTHALNHSNARLASSNAGLARAIEELDAQKQQIEEANAEMKARRDELARLIASLERTNQELGRSNLELEQFAYVASHDLQEPLRAVAGCVQVLQKRYAGQLDARADQFIHHAVDGAQRMQNLIQDLLLFSRVGTRGKPFEPTSLDAVLKRVLNNLSVSIRESGARITSEPLPTLACDAGQIEQVLQNLLANALKFRRVEPSSEPSSSGEKVMLPPTVHIGAQHGEAAKQWIVSVRDNGPGIESKYFERIWIMFQRLHTRTEYAGTGIGLAVCKKIIERHGGHVGVESSTAGAQQGSTFWFALPEHPVALGTAPEDAAPEEAVLPEALGENGEGRPPLSGPNVGHNGEV